MGCGYGSGTGSTRRLWLVIVQGVLDGYGMQGGESCMLGVGLYGLHSRNNCLMLLSPNIFLLLAFMQIYHVLAYS